jgi:hypothetical protein
LIVIDFGLKECILAKTTVRLTSGRFQVPIKITLDKKVIHYGKTNVLKASGSRCPYPE